MGDDLREHITLMAAPIFAAMLVPPGGSLPRTRSQPEIDRMMDVALTYALQLWRLSAAKGDV